MKGPPREVAHGTCQSKLSSAPRLAYSRRRAVPQGSNVTAVGARLVGAADAGGPAEGGRARGSYSGRRGVAQGSNATGVGGRLVRPYEAASASYVGPSRQAARRPASS